MCLSLLRSRSGDIKDPGRASLVWIFAVVSFCEQHTAQDALPHSQLFLVRVAQTRGDSWRFLVSLKKSSSSLARHGSSAVIIASPTSFCSPHLHSVLVVHGDIHCDPRPAKQSTFTSSLKTKKGCFTQGLMIMTVAHGSGAF